MAKYVKKEPSEHICDECGRTYLTKFKSRFCTKNCTDTYHIKQAKIHNCITCGVEPQTEPCTKSCSLCKTRRTKDKDMTGEEYIDYITCPLCLVKSRQISSGHAQMHGYENPTKMKEALGMKETTCQKMKDSVTGDKNPGYQHNGKFSVYSKNFIHGYDADRHARHKENASTRMSSKEYKESNKFSYEYWLKQAGGDEDIATVNYVKHQTRDLNWFVEKFGDEEGKVRHKAKIEKWANSFKKQNYSIISQRLFNDIMSQLPEDKRCGIYYATHQRDDMSDYSNKEFILQTDTSYVRPDFVCINTKRIIEFDGDYWHSEKVANPTRERERDEKIKRAGYEILHIKECDYNKNKESIIEQCLNYLIR